MDAAGDDKNSSTGESVFSLYGQGGSLSSVYSFLPTRSFGGEVGGAVRFSDFSIGATWMRTKAQFADALTATIPSPQVGAPARSVTGTTEALERHQDAVHVELAATLGKTTG